MFAVPGWSISADSLAQAQQSARKASGKTAALKSSHEPIKSMKRKRGDDEAAPQGKVAAADLERLWKKHFEPSSTPLNGIEGKKRRSDKILPGHRQGEGDSLQSKNDTVTAPGIAKVSVQKKLPKSKVRPAKALTDIESKAGNSDLADDNAGHAIKSKVKRQDKKLKESYQAPTGDAPSRTPAPMLTLRLSPPPSASNLTPLQAKMRNKLTSARFRHLNQTLYTTDSAAALSLFTNSPDLFAEYHAGFSQQVKDSWPQNPVDEYVRAIKTRGLMQSDDSETPLPRRKTGSCTIADLGCGDAQLARSCQSAVKTLKLKFHSFDLHAQNTLVTKADIANLPLRDGEADIAVFCLSLMGTNWLDFVEEAWRVLRGDGKGEVWLAEVKSRFGRRRAGVVENSVGKKRKNVKGRMGNDEGMAENEVFANAEGAEQNGDETDISAFVEVFSRRGFVLRPDSVDKANKMFISMVFVKSGIPVAGKHKGLKWTGREYQKQNDGKMRFMEGRDEEEVLPEEEAKALKPCVYKTR